MKTVILLIREIDLQTSFSRRCKQIVKGHAKLINLFTLLACSIYITPDANQHRTDRRFLCTNFIHYMFKHYIISFHSYYYADLFMHNKCFVV